MTMLKKKSDLKMLKGIWSKANLGKKEGKAMASLIYMMLSDTQGPPWSMKQPETPDIGRKVRTTWNDKVVEGKLIGYDNWGMASVIKLSKGGTLWRSTDAVEFI